MPQKILVIDDDPDIGELVCDAAHRLGMECMVTTDALSFQKALAQDITLVVLDLVMPGKDGVELLRLLAQQQCRSGIILTSGIGRRILETAEAMAISLGLSVVGHLLKPFRYDDLEAMLQQHSGPVAAQADQAAGFVLSEEELRRAIRNRELILHYQPQVDLQNKKIAGIEALVRWQHPEHGLLLPDRFLPQMEALNLMDDLSWFVVDVGLSDVQKFSERHPPLSLSINVSVSSLRNLNFPDVLLELIRKHGVQPENVVLEITETGIMHELANTLDVLSRLRMRSVRLSIDDFGMGYSMMQQLRQIPATELKIDKSFVQKTENYDDRVLVLKMIEIGHGLGMTVVAEGVETSAQMGLLKELRCDVAQGFLISKPIAAGSLSAWLINYTGEA